MKLNLRALMLNSTWLWRRLTEKSTSTLASQCMLWMKTRRDFITFISTTVEITTKTDRWLILLCISLRLIMVTFWALVKCRYLLFISWWHYYSSSRDASGFWYWRRASKIFFKLFYLIKTLNDDYKINKIVRTLIVYIYLK